MWGGIWYTVKLVSWIPKNGEEHPVVEYGAAMKTHPCRAALNSWFLGSGAHTGHPGSLATVNQASSKLDAVLESFAIH